MRKNVKIPHMSFILISFPQHGIKVNGIPGRTYFQTVNGRWQTTGNLLPESTSVGSDETKENTVI